MPLVGDSGAGGSLGATVDDSTVMKEAEIRRADLFARYLELSRADIASFFADPQDREECDCPACGGQDAVPAFSKHGFIYVECATCWSIYASPRPSAAALDAFYRDSESSRYWATDFFPAVAEARREKIVRPRVERILRHPQYGGDETVDPVTVIDVGAGAGTFLSEFSAAAPAATCIGVEPGAELAAQCRALGFRVVEEPVEQSQQLAGEGDVVTSFEVIEHVREPLAFVSAVARLVRPGGLVLVTGLGGDGFDIRVLGRESNAVAPPHHLNFLSVRGFERLFARAGLTDVFVETPGKLDVELVENAIRNGVQLEMPRFLALLIEHRTADDRQSFQRFLQEARLSSHTWIWARRGV